MRLVFLQWIQQVEWLDLGLLEYEQGESRWNAIVVHRASLELIVNAVMTLCLFVVCGLLFVG
jgi:hypothetical protein